MKKIISIFLVCLLLVTSIQPVQALSYSVSAAKTTLEIGQSTTVSINASGLSGRVNITATNASISASSFWFDASQPTASITVKPTTTGTVTLTVTPAGSDGLTYREGSTYIRVKESKSISINVIPKKVIVPVVDTRSKNNNLASLSIKDYNLNPTFSAGQTKYSVDVSGDTTAVTIQASTSDSKARVSGTGSKNVKVGQNVFNIVVTAENQTTKTYQITVNVDTTPQVFLPYLDKELGVVRDLSNIKIPTGFTEDTLKINDKNVTCYKNDPLNKTLLYLVNQETNEKYFYEYNQKDNKIVSIYRPVTICSQQFIITDIPKDKQELAGMTYEPITIDEIELYAYSFNNPDFKNYALLYLSTSDGTMNYYQYEKTQNTLQLYSNAAPVSMKDYTKLENTLESTKKEKSTYQISTICLVISTLLLTGYTLYTKKVSTIKKNKPQ